MNKPFVPTVRITFHRDGWRLQTKLNEHGIPGKHDWERLPTDQMIEFLQNAISEARLG